MIVIENLWKIYDGKPALKGITTRIEPGYVTVLLGPNGSGKTTLLKLILGLIKPDKGIIRVYGMDPYEKPLDVKRIIGFVPEEDLLYRSLRVIEYLYFVGKAYDLPKDELEMSVERVIKAFMLDGKRDELIGALSHGLKRRVLLAAAFIHRPKILLLDEPFMGLDPIIVKALKTFLYEEARSGKIVIVTTHVLEIAEAIADKVILLFKGEIVIEGSVEYVLRKSRSRGFEDAILRLLRADVEVLELVKALRM